jgi:hypothetical protein
LKEVQEMAHTKFIEFEDGTVFIFPETMTHSVVAGLYTSLPKAAGMCEFINDSWKIFGESITLGISSKGSSKKEFSAFDFVWCKLERNTYIGTNAPNKFVNARFVQPIISYNEYGEPIVKLEKFTLYSSDF